MAGWLEGGIRGYVGVTRSGKTTKAISDARTDAARTRFPIVTLDLGRSLSFAQEPHASCADEVIFDVWSRRVHPKVWTPVNAAERTKFFRVVGALGAVHIIGDEVKHIMDENKVDAAFVEAVNLWGHGKLGPTYWYLVAHRPKYINRDLGPGLDRIFFFRQTPGVDAKRAADEFGLDRHALETLARGEFREAILGFQD